MIKPLKVKIILLLVFLSCSQGKEEKVKSEMKGFWKVIVTTDRTDTTNFYVEINDSAMQYFQEDIAYLPPYAYEIVNSDTLKNWLLEDKSSRRVSVGKIEILSDSTFKITNSTQHFNFNKSSKEEFRADTGLRWLLDY